VQPFTYVNADGVEVTNDGDEEQEYGFGAEPSFYDFDNDPAEREQKSSCKRCLRKEMFGVKFRHWLYLLCFLLLALGISLYMWSWFNKQANADLEERISKLCQDRVTLTGLAVHNALRFATVTAASQ
jgi:hypothetical protein